MKRSVGSRSVVLVGVLIYLCLPVFVYKLGASSLYSFDEAWYAEIAKQIGLTGNLWISSFNNQVFTDHPPGGFWIISVGQVLAGVNEWGSRLPTAVIGMAGVAGLYLLGRELFNKAAGFGAAAALATAPWYVFRARSANLDVILTSLMIWSVFWVVKLARNDKFFWPAVLTLGLTFLVKTGTPLAVIPVVVWMLWKKKRTMILLLGLSLAPLGYWMWRAALASPIFWEKIISVGLPGVGGENNYWNNLMQVKTFVHHGIGNWFRWSVAALAICSLAIKKVKYAIPVVMTAAILGPMVLSDRARLWHMIPVYPFMLLGLFGVVSKLGRVATVLFCLWLCVPMMQKNWTEIVDLPAFVSDEAILSARAGKEPGKLYISENFLPAAVFYANKPVERMYGSLDELYETADSNYLLIAKEEQLNDAVKAKYEVLSSDRDKKLVKLEKF